MTATTNVPYYCNRPSLASLLISEGFTPEIKTNPWEPARTTWCFPISPKLCQIVSDYHREIGKTPPRIIMEGCSGGTAHE